MFDRSDSERSFFVWGIFQQEYDHLEGILFLDRLASPADLYSEEEYQKISNIAEYKR
ncbi:MAG: peptide deformylase [Microcystis sp. LE17-20A]|nr:peptide deformylase [Microcystis aeruginosa]MCZ8039102.1 peptide deformylase [Microcystis sp. LE17-20A]MCZ8211265.1 peptide deformylase [Microcystis sp. LE19-8.1F]